MEILDFAREPGVDVSNEGPSRARWLPMAESDGPCRIGRMSFGPDGLLEMHPTGVDQLFCVVEGSGWVRVEDGPTQALTSGQAAVWRTGEIHESGSDDGMEVIIIQAEHLTVGLDLSEGDEDE